MSRLFWSVVYVWFAAGCTSQSDAESASNWSGGGPWAIGERTLEIGGVDTIPGHALFRIRSAARAPDGDVVVADGSTNEVRVFDSAGTLVANFGGTGRGPNEFARLGQVRVLHPDTIMTYDRSTNRIGYWTKDGRNLGGLELPSNLRPTSVHRMTGGAIVAGVPIYGPPIGDIYVDSMAIFLTSADGESFDRIGNFPRITMFAGPSMTRPGPLYQGHPLMPTGTFTAGSSVSYVGYGDTWSVLRFDHNGAVLEPIECPLTRKAFTSTLRRQWIEDRIASVDPNEEEATRRFYSVFPIPDSLPTFDRLLVDDLEYLWARERFVPGSHFDSWRVVSPGGVCLGSVEVPRSVQPIQIGRDFILAVVRDANDIEKVVIFDLLGRGD